jgi:hypothetical protein
VGIPQRNRHKSATPFLDYRRRRRRLYSGGKDSLEGCVKKKRAVKRGLAAVGLSAAVGISAYAEPLIGTSRSTFGLTGLIDMPTAESAPEGTLAGSAFYFPGGMRTSLTFQVTDRLSGAFRYSRVPKIFTGGSALFDRSFDLHYRLLDESGMRPAIAVGLRDFVGTGIYSSEYVVATKSIGPDIRVTGGLGWGRLGSKGGIGSPFGSRPPLDFGLGGKANTDQWFRGPAAPFAGISWNANDKLTLKAEYSTDAYAAETAAGTFDRKSSVNVGFDYNLGPMASLSGYYLYGSEVGLQFNIIIDPRNPPVPSGLETAPLPVRPRPSAASDPSAWATDWTADPEVHPGIQTALAKALAKDGQVLEAMALSADRAEVRVRNQRYLARPEAIGRTARAMTRALPPSVETLVITSVVQGVPTSSVTLKRSDVETLENKGALEILRRAEFSDAVAGDTSGLRMTENVYPRFVWSLAPYAEASLFDPDDPFRADFGAQLAAKYEFAPGLVLSGSVRKKLFGNLDQSTRVSDSTVRHVRSDLVLYQKEGDPAINDLTLAWYARPGADFYSRVTVGYLERMYGGVSGEVLWKPVDSRLALGAEVNYVKQRDFDQLFGFQDYSTVTGHASAYYDLGGGFTTQLDVGRYLLGDWGATFSLDREFANGWRVGAFATLTDLPFEDFGEGSFDKGIRISIPVAWTTGKPSTNKVSTTIRPLTRDGGARLEVDGRIYERIRDSHQGDLIQTWGRFWR